MTNLPFHTYEESKEYFGVAIPENFFTKLVIINTFCQTNGLDTLDTLFDVFGILRIEGKEARYQQTPIELFPFGSVGSDGIHYGFMIHATGEDDYPSAEICPMDDDGAVIIGNDSNNLFQNLLQDVPNMYDFFPLLQELKLNPIVAESKRYDESGNTLRINVKAKKGWKFLETTDGAGVFAEEHYFDNKHLKHYNFLNSNETIEQYEKLVTEMFNRGLYASQLYYLKELYWNEWTDHELARKYLNLMLCPYEKLNRPHLYEMTKWTIDKFYSKNIS